MDGRNVEDCLAASIAWLTGEDINVLPSDFFADMYVSTGKFRRKQGWPQWFKDNGYTYNIKVGEHHRGLHVAHFWIERYSDAHSVVCDGNKVVYDCTDPIDRTPRTDLWASLKITKKKGK